LGLHQEHLLLEALNLQLRLLQALLRNREIGREPLHVVL
jgi:hypothetical protein